MKPLKLIMQSFGSYGERTEIDFEVPAQNLFLVTGDTGAGKTTIFDAIVFALYAETGSAENRKYGAELQSHFAGYDKEPFVELTFQEGPDIYRILRKPARLRPKMRGEGTMLQAGSVSLIMPDGREYPAKETNRKIREIIGLEKEQFMQVAMIAQGEFMELLRAKSDDKKEIFSKLFGTGLYGDVTAELERRKNEKKQETAVLWTECRMQAALVTIPEEYGEAQTMQALKKAVTGDGQPDAASARDFMEQLGVLCAVLAEKKQAAEETYQKAVSLRDDSRAVYAGAENLMQLFSQLETAKRELAECDREEAPVREMRRLLKEISSAFEIRMVYQLYADAAAGRMRMEEQKDSLKQRLPELVTADAKSREDEAEAKQEQEKALADYTATEAAVKKDMQLQERITQLSREIKEAEAGYSRAASQVRENDRKKKETAVLEQQWKQEAEALSDIGQALAANGIKKEKLLQMKEKAEDARKLYQEQRQLADKAAPALEEYKSASEEYERVNRTYELKRKAFLDAQAGLIAAEQLVPGQPCPVCGSLTHPAPCELKEEFRGLTQKMVEDLKQKADTLRKTQEEKAVIAKTTADRLEKAGSSFADACARLQIEAGKDPLDVLIRETDSALAKLGREEADLRKKESRKNRIAGELASLAAEKEKLEAEAEEGRKVLEEARTRLERGRASLESLMKTGEYRDLEEAKAHLARCTEEKKKRDAAWEKMRERAKKAGTALDGARTLLQRYESELPGLIADCGEKKAAYDKICLEKELSEEKWKELTGKYTQDEADQLQKRIAAHEQKKAAAKKLHLETSRSIGERPKPDLAQLSDQMRSADLAAEEAGKIFSDLNALERENRKIRGMMEESCRTYAASAAAFEQLNTLYRIASGNIRGARMDLETYVLRYYLREILRSANRRFAGMTGGQYELRMLEPERAGEGKNRGLDLLVYSAVTGRERDVKTLSGGESFMAALSLALGLADQIRESCPSVSLDIMFIDEGFGSLDDEARTQAVRVLQDVAGETRLLGIISHVTELKQEIEDQLVVTKDVRGSHVRWQVS